MNHRQPYQLTTTPMEQPVRTTHHPLNMDKEGMMTFPAFHTYDERLLMAHRRNWSWNGGRAEKTQDLMELTKDNICDTEQIFIHLCLYNIYC